MQSRTHLWTAGVDDQRQRRAPVKCPTDCPVAGGRRGKHRSRRRPEDRRRSPVSPWTSREPSSTEEREIEVVSPRMTSSALSQDLMWMKLLHQRWIWPHFLSLWSSQGIKNNKQRWSILDPAIHDMDQCYGLKKLIKSAFHRTGHLLSLTLQMIGCWVICFRERRPA